MTKCCFIYTIRSTACFVCAKLTLNARSCFCLSCCRNVRLMKSYPEIREKGENVNNCHEATIVQQPHNSHRPSLSLSLSLFHFVTQALFFTLLRSPKQSMETPESPLTEFFLDTGELVADSASGETPRSSELLLVEERSISSLKQESFESLLVSTLVLLLVSTNRLVDILHFISNESLKRFAC